MQRKNPNSLSSQQCVRGSYEGPSLLLNGLVGDRGKCRAALFLEAQGLPIDTVAHKRVESDNGISH